MGQFAPTVASGSFEAAACERRRQPRVALGQRGQARPAAGGAWQTVLVRDLSDDGVGLQVDQRMAPGHPLVLRLTGPGGEAAELHCVVRWCEPGGFLNVAFHVGASLIDPPPAQGLGPTRPTWLADMLVGLRFQQAMAEPPRRPAGPGTGRRC